MRKTPKVVSLICQTSSHTPFSLVSLKKESILFNYNVMKLSEDRLGEDCKHRVNIDSFK